MFSRNSEANASDFLEKLGKCFFITYISQWTMKKNDRVVFATIITRLWLMILGIYFFTHTYSHITPFIHFFVISHQCQFLHLMHHSYTCGVIILTRCYNIDKYCF